MFLHFLNRESGLESHMTLQCHNASNYISSESTSVSFTLLHRCLGLECHSRIKYTLLAFPKTWAEVPQGAATNSQKLFFLLNFQEKFVDIQRSFRHHVNYQLYSTLVQSFNMGSYYISSNDVTLCAKLGFYLKISTRYVGGGAIQELPFCISHQILP